jgi:hypothetical protein
MKQYRLIKFEMEAGWCLTFCPHRRDVMVYSLTCQQRCIYYRGETLIGQRVKCSFVIDDKREVM